MPCDLLSKFLLLCLLSICAQAHGLSQSDLSRMENTLNSINPNDPDSLFHSLRAFKTGLVTPRIAQADLSSLVPTPRNLLLLSSLPPGHPIPQPPHYDKAMEDALASNNPKDLLYAVLAHQEANRPIPLDDIRERLGRMASSLASPAELVPALLLCGHLGGMQEPAQKLHDRSLKHLLLVDGNTLQFRGDLPLTAQFLQSLYLVALPLRPDVTRRLLAHVLSGKYSSSPHILAAVLETIRVIQSSPAHTLTQVTPESCEGGVLTISVGDLLDHPLPGETSVSCMGKNFSALGEGRFRGKITGKWGPIFLTCHVTPPENTFPPSDHLIEFNNLADVTLHTPKLGTSGSTSGHVDNSIDLTFSLSAGGEPFRPEQAFVQFLGSGWEISYLADYSEGTFHFFLSRKDAARDFGGRSGTYQLRLLLGDSRMESIVHPIAPLTFQFAQTPPPRDRFQPKQLHQHTFRESQRQPPRMISLVFTAAAVTPLPLLLLAWLSFGGSVLISFPSLLFYLSFGGILSLYGLYWTHLNIFQTLKCLALLSLPAAFSASRMLRGLALMRR